MRIPPDTLLALFPVDEPLVTPADFWAAESVSDTFLRSLHSWQTFNAAWLQLATAVTLPGKDPLGSRHALLTQFRTALTTILEKRYREFDALLPLHAHPQRAVMRATRAYHLSRERLAPTLLNALSALRSLAGEEVDLLGDACTAALVRTLSTAWILYRSFAVSEIRDAVAVIPGTPSSPTTVPSSPITVASTPSTIPSTPSSVATTNNGSPSPRSPESTTSLVDALERLHSSTSVCSSRSTTPTPQRRSQTPTTPTAARRSPTPSPMTPRPTRIRATTAQRSPTTSPGTPRARSV